jgi:hypothetical protein
MDKERKKARAEQKELFKNNVDLIQGKLNELTQEIELGSITNESALITSKELADEIQRTPLGRDFHLQLRNQLADIQKPLQERLHAEEIQRRQQVEDRIKQKKSKALELRTEIEALMSNLDSFDSDKIIAKRDEMQQKIASLPATKLEKQELENLLKPIKEAIVDKREKALMMLSSDDRQAVLELKELLKQRKDQRQEIRAHLESLRRSRGSSSLDFEQALNVNTQEAADKERLEKVSQMIAQIENKLAEIEK